MASESTSSSYSGIPLVGPSTTWNPGANGGYSPGLGVPDAYTFQVTSPGQPTPAAGILSNDLSSIAGLYGLQPSAGYNSALGGVTGNAASMQGIASGLNGGVSGDLNYANQALATAFDPQQTAYNYYLQQALNAAGANEAASGTSASPYGAEVTGATAANFGNNWQTQQVARENTGANTASTLQNTNLGYQTAAANIFNSAGQLDQSAAGDYLQQFGLQGANMAAALSALTSLFGDMKVGVSGSQSASS